MALTIIVILAITVVGATLFSRNRQEQQLNERISTFTQDANALVEHMKSVVDSSAPVNWVYDRDGKFYTLIKVSSELQGVHGTPKTLADRIVFMSNGDAVDFVIQEYCHDNNIEVTDELLIGYTKRLSEETALSAVDYLATESVFGGKYVGAEDAANNYFGTSLQKCSNEQLLMLADAYRDDTFSVEGWLTEHNLDKKELGISDDSAQTVRSAILEELREIPGIDLNSQGYNVQVSISRAQQATIQSVVDTGLKHEIDLNAVSSFSVDCSVLVVDATTSFARVFVPCRTNGNQSKVFRMNAQGFCDNYSALQDEVEKENVFPFSLKEVSTATGDVELRAISDLYLSQNLVESTKDDYKSVQDLASVMFYRGGGKASLVTMVKDSFGNVVFKSDSARRIGFENDKLCSYFGLDGGTSACAVKYRLQDGIILAYMTANYIVVVEAGSNTIGEHLSQSTSDSIDQTINDVLHEVSTFYPTPRDGLWDASSFAGEVTTAYEQNKVLLMKHYSRMLDKLSNLKIDSVESRHQFEVQYEETSNYLGRYESYLSSNDYQELLNSLEQVRVSKVADLLKYSVN